MDPEAELAFALVDPGLAREAFQWHRGFAAADEHLFPRTWEQYSALAEEWQVACAKEADGTFIGLAYFALEESEWEVGGLMVAAAWRGRGVGSTLMRLTLGHVLFEEDPLSRGESVIAHVHQDNQDPRLIIEHALKFGYRKSVKVPGDKLPGLRTDEEGFVHGDEFELQIPESLEALAAWCRAWPGALKDGRRARIELRDHTTLEMWAAAFEAMAKDHRA